MRGEVCDSLNFSCFKQMLYLAFDIHITAASYALSLLCTVLFAVAVNLFMKRQIGKIQMAESLKAVE